MAIRHINGYTVESIAVPNDPSIPLYIPALRVTKPETNFDETNEEMLQNYERLSEDEAQEIADESLASVRSVTVFGQVDF